MFYIVKNNVVQGRKSSYEEAKIYLLSTAYNINPSVAKQYEHEVQISIEEDFVHGKDIWKISRQYSDFDSKA